MSRYRSFGHPVRLEESVLSAIETY